MKKLLFLLLVLIFGLISVNIFSIDFGGSVSSATSFKWADDDSVNEKAKAVFWVSHQFSPNIDFIVQGSYTYTYEGTNHVGDLNKLILNGQYPLPNFGPSLLKFSVGRFMFSDFSGQVINHTLDGLKFGFDFPILSVTAYAGYSGLLTGSLCGINMTKSDVTDKADEDVYLGPKRIIEGAEILFPQLFANQNLHLSFWFQQDLRNDNLVEAGDTAEQSTIGGKINTQYMGLGVSGEAAATFYYNTFFFVGTGKTLSYTGSEYEEANILSFLGGGGFRLYFKEALFSTISFEGLYSSGDEDSTAYFKEGNTSDNALMFVPISKSSPALVFSPELGNIIYLKAGYSFKPFSRMGYSAMENFQTVVNGIVFLRPTTGQISEPGLNAGSDSAYLGTELDFTVNFRPFSDLGTGISVGLFYPSNDSSDALAGRDKEVLVKFDLSYSF